MEKQIIDWLRAKTGKSQRDIERILNLAKNSIRPSTKRVLISHNELDVEMKITRNGFGPINTRYGKFQLYNFIIDDQWVNYFCIINCKKIEINGNPKFSSNELLVRIDSGCETGQRFHDKSCDCKEQLEKTIEYLGGNEGIIISIPKQDGRGKGLAWKLTTLQLQDSLKLDTVRAAEITSILSSDGIEQEIDTRTYEGIIAILRYFGISKDTTICLATNNPKKILVFKKNQYKIKKHPLIIPLTKDTKNHLLAKQYFLGHNLNLTDETN